uniref:Uncharacterized protein n=1 Tax=Anguilla anguilla TaxID=7936 RepID=A0A0E9Q1J9_ANGAN
MLMSHIPETDVNRCKWSRTGFQLPHASSKQENHKAVVIPVLHHSTVGAA